MHPTDLVPSPHRAERRLILDLIVGAETRSRFGIDVDAGAFLAVAPEMLLPLLYVRLVDRRSPLEVPDALLIKLAEHYRGSTMLHLQRRVLLRKITDTLGLASIEALVLKGAVLAETVYDEPALRPMADLDLLVRPGAMDRAQACLEAAGFRVPVRYFGNPLEAGLAPPLELPGYGTILELHEFIDSTGRDRTRIDRFWERSRRVSLHGIEVGVPGREDFLTHVVLHASKHHRFESMLRALLDIERLMAHWRDQIDWSAIHREVSERSDLSWFTLTLYLTEAILGAEVPPPFDRETPDEEAMAIAAEQLWPTLAARLPPRVLFTLAGRKPSDVHPHLDGGRVPIPPGARGVAIRAHRFRLRLNRVWGAFRKGSLRPARVLHAVRLFRRREKLVMMMEPDRSSS